MTFNYSTHVGNDFSNPIFTASGCASSGKELSQFFNLKEFNSSSFPIESQSVDDYKDYWTKEFLIAEGGKKLADKFDKFIIKKMDEDDYE